MNNHTMRFTCSAAEVGVLDYGKHPRKGHYGAQVAFVNTHEQKGIVQKLRKYGFKRVGAYIGASGDNVAIMLRINRPLKKRAKKACK